MKCSLFVLLIFSSAFAEGIDGKVRQPEGAYLRQKKTVDLSELEGLRAEMRAANSSSFPQYLSDISKSYLCTRNAGVAPIDLSVGASLRFIADGNNKKAKELIDSDVRTSIMSAHDELCASDDIKTAFDYMTSMSSKCEFTCRGVKGCLRVCFTVRDVQLMYLEGVLSGKNNCTSKQPPNAGTIR